MLTELLENILLNESVSVSEIDDAIDNHKRIIINYHSYGEDIATGARIIEVYAYGVTKAGNPVIRAFQPYGDTRSKVPSWKFFRLDRISYWKETNQTFSEPASDIYKGLGDFNPDGDETMGIVYKIAKFGNKNTIDKDNMVMNTNPKLKDDVFKTDSEKKMERLKQQVINPIRLSDIKTKNGFIDYNKQPSETGPKLKNSAEKEQTVDNVFNTSTAKQDIDRLNKSETDRMNRADRRWEKSSDSRYLNRKDSLNRELDNLRDKLGDTSNPITKKELEDRLKNDEEEEENT